LRGNRLTVVALRRSAAARSVFDVRAQKIRSQQKKNLLALTADFLGTKPVLEDDRRGNRKTHDFTGQGIRHLQGENKSHFSVMNIEFADDENAEQDKSPLGGIAEAEFSEVRILPRPSIEEDGPDAGGEVIAGEVVEPAPRAKAADVQSVDTEPDPLEAFLANIPRDSDVTIVVKRKPDHGIKFRQPCNEHKWVCNLYWDQRAAEEIYALIQRKEGGGRYGLQFQYGGGFNRAWDVTIDDPADLSDREKTIRGDDAKDSEPERKPDVSQPFVPTQPPADSLDTLKKTLRDAQELKELLGINDKPDAAAGPTYTIQEQIALEMMKTTSGDPELGGQVIKKILGLKDDKGEKAWSDVAWHAVSHAGELIQVVTTVAGIAGPLLGFGQRGPVPVNIPVGSLVRVQPDIAAATHVVMPPAADMPPETAADATAAPVAPVQPVQDVSWG